MAKANATTTTEQQPVASPLSFDLKQFSDEQYRATEMVKFPIAIMLNQKPEPLHGMFIKEDALKMAGWHGPSPSHTNTFGAGNKELGLLLQAPRMLIINQSSRFVEAKKNNGKFPIHPHTKEELKPGTIVGNYETPEGKDLHEKMKVEGFSTLRTFYLFYLLDENNQRLHDIPFMLSIKGAAAVSFGQAYEQFKIQLASAYAKVTKTGFSPKNQAFCAMGVFAPTLVVTKEGQDAKSDVTTVGSFEEPSGASPEEFCRHFLGQLADELKELVEASRNFAKPGLESLAQYHQALPGVDLSDRPQLPQSSLGAGTGEDAITVVATVADDDGIDW